MTPSVATPRPPKIGGVSDLCRLIKWQLRGDPGWEEPVSKLRGLAAFAEHEAMADRRRQVPFTEPVPVPDFFATGAEVSYHLDWYRLTFWTGLRLVAGSANHRENAELRIGARIIMPDTAFRQFQMGIIGARPRDGH